MTSKTGAFMIVARAIDKKIIVTINDDCVLDIGFILQRHSDGDCQWQTYTNELWQKVNDTKSQPQDAGVATIEPLVLHNTDFLDTDKFEGTQNGLLYAYRYIASDKDIFTSKDEEWQYSNWVKVASASQVGYTFGNYKTPQGQWGELVTCDDMRYTYLWGTDFKAANGQSYTDAQIEYFVKSAMCDMERKLDITIKKQRIRCNATVRNLEKGKDYDSEEAMYDFRYGKISRYAVITTRQRPILQLHSLQLCSRLCHNRELKDSTIIDSNKGILKLLERPVRPNETYNNIGQAIGMYGNQTMGAHLFYAIDYDAGFENSDSVPSDLREIVAKHAAVSLLNIIGDGLMSGFSSSSLSMDGLSESFSSTQSATSAYFGARIKEYKDDIDAYIKANKNKFGHINIGAL